MSAAPQTLQANLVDIPRRTIYQARVHWQAGRIQAIEYQGGEKPGWPYLLPGFIDAHVHIESAMLPPCEFARQAMRHGTVGTVSDPHEIANVLGLEGIDFMLDNARQTPFHILFGAPCCVPATAFESTGAQLSTQDVERLLDTPGIGYLSEMMNVPGVLHGDPQVLAKIQAAAARRLPIDGHAPGLTGQEAIQYAASGITTDHECSTLDEAEFKLKAGMKILIREGSAARNFTALHPLIAHYPEQLMFCSDDKHPDDLLNGHIDRLVARAIEAGHDRFNVLQIACLNPIQHYRLEIGRLRPKDSFDAILVEDLQAFKPLKTFVQGIQTAENGESLLPHQAAPIKNRFQARPIQEHDLFIKGSKRPIHVIGVIDGELLTHDRQLEPKLNDGRLMPDLDRDILPILVLNRYRPTPPALGFIQGFGLQRGAIASSVAHDAHNIVAVGADFSSLRHAVNTLIEHQGGIAVCDGHDTQVLPLPIAGLMSPDDGEWVGKQYQQLDQHAHALGCTLKAPFMTLSFMALLVIPQLKLSDRGLFDGKAFQFVPLQT